ncbi:MAG: AAA family ATPase, partial [Candidatus Sericytochromatia bacterium]|nr:AAA family ATPase [Candidatus Sericytochromatia bacterium]
MPRIISVDVEGLAGRSKRLAFSLNPDINIIFGVNGTGKTSLLRILHSALVNDTSLIENTPFSTAKIEILGDNGEIYQFFIDKNAVVEEDWLNSTLNPSIIRKKNRYSLSNSYRPQWKVTPELNGKEEWGNVFLPTYRITQGIETKLSAALSSAQSSAQEEAAINSEFERIL